MATQRQLLTDEARALIGFHAPSQTSSDTVNSSEIRRFAQAVMDDHRIWYDEKIASASRFGGLVAPGTFPITTLRPQPHAPDSLRTAGVRDEMYQVAITRDLPEIPGLEGMYHFHAGDDIEFRRLARVGDRMTANPSLHAIYEKTGRSGTLVFVTTRTEWVNQDSDVVCVHDQNLVYTEGTRQRGSAGGPARQRSGDPPPMPQSEPLDLVRTDFEDVEEGQELSQRQFRITVPIVMRWAAATEGFRRDHYDYEYATQVAGLPNIIGSALWTLSCRWSYLNQIAGADGWVWKMSHQVRGHIMVGDNLTISGRVVEKERCDGYGLVKVEVAFVNQDGETVIPGHGTIALPFRGGTAVPYPFSP
ncbi:MAG: MaoC family dehydratase N-terminal domain-containing protein [Dehalococcoidia bacterium]